MHLLPVALAFGVFLAHSSRFWGWIVDDAGISFAYSRSLAQGYGLVSQPGAEAVEGFSNPLWVALFAPLIRAGLFDPIVVPKAVSLLLIAASFLVLHRAMLLAIDSGEARQTQLVAALPLLLLSLNTSFVVWTTSGLENPLLVLEISLLLYLSLRAVVEGGAGTLHAILIGLTVSAAALTRPDAVLLVLAFPALIAAGIVPDRRSLPLRMRSLVAYLAAFAAPVGAYVGFRLLYFGELYPNTYHAKGGVSTGEIDGKARDLMESVLGFTQPEAGLLVLGAVLAGTALTRRPPVLATGVFFCVTAAGILLLPQDWMRENRFCSAFAVVFYVLAGLLAEGLVRAVWTGQARLWPAAGLMAGGAALVVSSGLFIERSADFSRRPTVPLTTVRDYFGDRFSEYARMTGTSEASILTVDIGGLLYYSDMRVYDLAGLTDRTIARQLQDEAAFHAYVLDEIKPTFIHTHGLYAVWAAFDRNPRFRAEYRAICEQIDPWIRDVWRFNWFAGDYVRWEVAPDDALVEEMAKHCRKELPYPSN